MSVESEIFKRARINYKKLIEFGFKEENNVFIYSKVIFNNFKIVISIDKNMIVSGKVYDLDLNEEYTNFRLEGPQGEFINKIQNKYKLVLLDILNNCCEIVYFINDQTNRITELINNLYNDNPVFPWEKYNGYGVFKNPKNGKWYGLIVNIDKSKLDKNSSGEIEIINVKLEKERIIELIDYRSFFPAYHMNKEHWISIILDDSLSDDEILNYIRISHSFTEK